MHCFDWKDGVVCGLFMSTEPMRVKDRQLHLGGILPIFVWNSRNHCIVQLAYRGSSWFPCGCWSFALAPFHQWNPLPDDLLESAFELKLLLLHTDSSHFTIHLDVLPTWILLATLIKQRWLRMRRSMFLELASKNRLQLCQASHCWWLPCVRNLLISLVMQLVLERKFL